MFALPLALLIALPSDQELSFISVEDVPNQPFANLLEQKNEEDYSKGELGALRARIEQERDEKLAAARKTEEVSVSDPAAVPSHHSSRLVARVNQNMIVTNRRPAGAA